MRRAFTLIEAATVTVILAALAAVAWAGFTAVQTNTGSVRVKTELRQTAGSLATYEQSRGYFPVDADMLAKLEPNFTFVIDGQATIRNQISISVASIDGVEVLGLAARGEGNKCFTMTQPPLDEETIEITTATFTPSGADPCSAAEALTKSGRAW